MEVLRFIGDVYYSNGTMKTYECYKIVPINCDCGEDPFCLRFKSYDPCLVSKTQPIFESMDSCQESLADILIMTPISTEDHTAVANGNDKLNLSGK